MSSIQGSQLKVWKIVFHVDSGVEKCPACAAVWCGYRNLMDRQEGVTQAKHLLQGPGEGVFC